MLLTVRLRITQRAITLALCELLVATLSWYVFLRFLTVFVVHCSSTIYQYVLVALRLPLA
jgi:hypothetical protein